MGRLLGSLLAIALLACTGCVARSFHPFYTQKAKIETPKEILGAWKPVSGVTEDGEAEKKMKPWVCKEGKALIHDAKNFPSVCQTVFFKIGKQVYCDFILPELAPPGDSNINTFSILSLVNAHVLCKVQLGDDMLRLTPMALDGVKAIKEAKLPSIAKKENGENAVLFTASPEQWVAFLEAYGSNVELCNKAPVYVFRKATLKEIEASKAKTAEQAPLKVTNLTRYQLRIKDLNYSVRLQTGQTDTLAMEMMLVLGRKPEEIKKGIKVSDMDMTTFLKAVKSLEPSVRNKLRQYVAKKTHAQLITPVGTDGIKKFVKDYVNGKLKTLKLDLENKDLARDRVVDVLMLTYYMQ